MHTYKLLLWTATFLSFVFFSSNPVQLREVWDLSGTILQYLDFTDPFQPCLDYQIYGGISFMMCACMSIFVLNLTPRPPQSEIRDQND